MILDLDFDGAGQLFTSVFRSPLYNNVIRRGKFDERAYDEV